MLQFVAVVMVLVLAALVGIQILSFYVKSTFGMCKCSRQMVGKVVIVTGASSGIGYETAKDLAERGAKVIFTSNDDYLGKEAMSNIIKESGNKNVHYYHLELCSLDSIRKFANIILKNETRLDVLINNAGVFLSSDVKTKDGLLPGLQINYFGPFLLTYLLLPLLKVTGPSRIINVSSIVYRGRLCLDDVKLEKCKFSSINVYMMSKMYIVIMTIEMARRLANTQITVNCLHPGMVSTNIISHTNIYSILKKFDLFITKFIKTAWEGAQTSIYLAVSPNVKNTSGGFFTDCTQVDTISKVQDRDTGKKLWDITFECLNLKHEQCTNKN